MLWNISFLDFRKANGCGARYTPLKALLVHPSPLPLSITFIAGVISSHSSPIVLENGPLITFFMVSPPQALKEAGSF